MFKKSPSLLPGQKFGRLTVVKLAPIRKIYRKNGHIEKREYYLCKCDCGKEITVYKSVLKNGYIESCGCAFIEKLIKRVTKHGMEGTRIYRIWASMKQRCYNKKSKRYLDYGGRGITMYNEWKNDFMEFYTWAMANGYKDTLTIDRIDVNGNYEPANCRWSTMKEQQRNRRNNRIIGYKGEKHCVSEWAEKLGIPRATLESRFNYGWSIEKTLSTKVM